MTRKTRMLQKENNRLDEQILEDFAFRGCVGWKRDFVYGEYLCGVCGDGCVVWAA